MSNTFVICKNLKYAKYLFDKTCEKFYENKLVKCDRTKLRVFVNNEFSIRFLPYNDVEIERATRGIRPRKIIYDIEYEKVYL